MSVVPSAGLIRKHYNEACNDIEYKSAAFWQIWLQRTFSEIDEYAVTTESAPDESLRRVDIVVKRYDAQHDTPYALLWVECKRPRGSVREVEDQALDAATRCIANDNLKFIYAMTTIGVSFRTWRVQKGTSILEPLHGENLLYERSEYVDADSAGAASLTQTVGWVKNFPPLRDAPVVLSQPESSHPFPQEEKYPSGYQPYGLSSGQTQKAGSQPQHQDQGQAAPASNIKPYLEVSVMKTAHSFRPDEYVFKDSSGAKRSSLKGDWQRGQDSAGNEIWIYETSRTRYFSRTRIA